MSDDFLHQQQAPRRAFADALARQLKAQEEENVIASNGHLDEVRPYASAITEPSSPPAAASRPRRRLRFVSAAAVIAACIGLLFALAVQPRPVEQTYLTQIDSRLLPDNLERITAENVGQLELLAALGEGIILSADWSPDGGTIAAGGARGMWLLDALNPTDSILLSAGESMVTSVRYNAAGSKLAAGDSSGAVYIYDVANLQLEATIALPAETGQVQQVEWLTDRQIVVSTSRILPGESEDRYEAALWLYDASTGEWALTPLVPNLLFGSKFAVTASGSTVHLTYSVERDDAAILTLMDIITQETHELARYNVGAPVPAFSSDGERLYAAADQGIAGWQVDSRERSVDIVNRREYLAANRLMVSPDGVTVVLADTNLALVAYDVETGEAVHQVQAGPYTGFPVGLDFSPDGSEMLLATTSELRFLNPSGEIVRSTVTHQNGVSALALNDAADTLAALEWGDNQPLRLWDLATGDYRPLTFTRDAADYFHAGTAAMLSGDSTRLLTQSASFTTLVDTAAGQPLWVHRTHEGMSANFIREDSQVVIFDAGTDSIVLLDAQTGAEVSVIPVESQLQAGAVWGETVAVGVFDPATRQAQVSVYELSASEPALVAELLQLGDVHVDALAFSSDGTSLAIAAHAPSDSSVASTGSIVAWEWHTDEAPSSILETPGQISGLLLNEDASLVLGLTQWDGMLHIWERQTGDLLTRIPDAERGWALTTAALSRDERLLIMGGYDGLVRIWGVRRQ